MTIVLCCAATAAVVGFVAYRIGRIMGEARGASAAVAILRKPRWDDDIYAISN